MRMVNSDDTVLTLERLLVVLHVVHEVEDHFVDREHETRLIASLNQLASLQILSDNWVLWNTWQAKAVVVRFGVDRTIEHCLTDSISPVVVPERGRNLRVVTSC